MRALNIHRGARALATLWVALAFSACGPTTHTVLDDDGGTGEVDAGPPPDIPMPGQSIARMVGPEGATLTLGSLELDVPAGAVATPTMITVTATGAAPPSSFTAYSPVFRFEPEGMQFDEPVSVRLPFDGRLATASVFWTAEGSDAYVARATTVEGRLAVAQTQHFSSAFVGSACAGDDCCTQANGELDVLLMVDNSNSMMQEQASLRAELPHLARVLATGDLDGDGVQDFPAVESLHMGTVSTDMGTRGFSVPTCLRSDFGDDGLLTQTGRTDLPNCDASYPPFAVMDDGTDLEDFVQQMSCTAPLGTGGCGFEQPLDAVLKALSPASPAIFYNNTGGHAETGNQNFLRPDSVLATILVTDENDCSAADPEIFNQDSVVYTEELNIRCFSNPNALHPIERYSDGLRALRSDPDDLIFGLIAGVPVDLSGQDPATILADPRMVETISATATDQLEPSCDVPGRGVAYPPNRMLEVARELGDNSVVQSICQEDFSPVLDAILTQVAARVSGRCGG